MPISVTLNLYPQAYDEFCDCGDECGEDCTREYRDETVTLGVGGSRSVANGVDESVTVEVASVDGAVALDDDDIDIIAYALRRVYLFDGYAQLAADDPWEATAVAALMVKLGAPDPRVED